MATRLAVIAPLHRLLRYASNVGPRLTRHPRLLGISPAQRANPLAPFPPGFPHRNVSAFEPCEYVALTRLCDPVCDMCAGYGCYGVPAKAFRSTAAAIAR